MNIKQLKCILSHDSAGGTILISMPRMAFQALAGYQLRHLRSLPCGLFNRTAQAQTCSSQGSKSNKREQAPIRNTL